MSDPTQDSAALEARVREARRNAEDQIECDEGGIPLRHITDRERAALDRYAAALRALKETP